LRRKCWDGDITQYIRLRVILLTILISNLIVILSIFIFMILFARFVCYAAYKMDTDDTWTSKVTTTATGLRLCSWSRNKFL